MNEEFWEQIDKAITFLDAASYKRNTGDALDAILDALECLKHAMSYLKEEKSDGNDK